ncbi:MAG: hypothetical protein FJY82_07840 [Candidatus Aminicenantes bacterium]|nr:hypothetical protein [Candidatus Aminicenantes bacterium]
MAATRFLLERGLRLLVPPAIGILVLSPPQIYLERLTRGEFSGGFAQFLFGFLIFANDDIQGAIVRRRWAALVLALALTPIPPLITRSPVLPPPEGSIGPVTDHGGETGTGRPAAGRATTAARMGYNNRPHVAGP